MSRKGHERVVKNRSYEIMAREVEKRYFELLESYKGRDKIGRNIWILFPKC
jgi:hypothetical protein